MKTTGARLLLKCILNQNIKILFGVPGESYLSILDALISVKTLIKMTIKKYFKGL